MRKLPLRRAKNAENLLAVRLPLHALDRHINIKMFLFNVLQLVPEHIFLLFLGEKRVDVTAEAAVVVRHSHALDAYGKRHRADVVINHAGAPR